MRRSGDSLFGPSFPFSGLFRAQGTRYAESVSVMNSIFRDFTEVGGKCERIHAIGTQSEAGSREINRQLSLTLILPRDRDDIRDLSLGFDSCLGAVKSTATRIGLYEFRGIRKPAVELGTNLEEMAAEIRRMLEVMNLGKGVEESARNVAGIWAEAERFLLVGLGELYEMPDVRAESVLEVVKWSQIYDRLEEALSRAERVARIIEGIALKLL